MLYNPCFLPFQARGRESIVSGFYHEGYEGPLLMLMKRRGVHSGLVIKVTTWTCNFWLICMAIFPPLIDVTVPTASVG